MKSSSAKPFIFSAATAALLGGLLFGCGDTKKPDGQTASQGKGQSVDPGKGNGGNKGAPCEYEGVTYQSGDTFPSSDGCNDCACNDGLVACTARACQGYWYYTCGDPVCRVGGHRPDPNLRDCTTEQAGDACDPIDDMCDPDDDCNARLVCATSDPRMHLGGCPISRAAYKRDIHYLDRGELKTYANELLQMRLATYRYKAAGADGPQQLGFIIDDVAPSVSVNGDQQTVNLYGYTSMAVAALKTQAEQIQRLEQQVAELKSQVETLKRSAKRPTR